jgi:hypothetical protein
MTNASKTEAVQATILNARRDARVRSVLSVGLGRAHEPKHVNGTPDMCKYIDTLVSMYEKEHLSNLKLRETLRRVRQEKSLKDRQVQLANRTIERLAVHRGTTEAQDAIKDAQIRRLKTHLSVLEERGDLKDACEELEERVRALEAEIADQRASVDESDQIRRALEEENLVLKRGVQLASDLGVCGSGGKSGRTDRVDAGGGNENTTSLLLAVAKSQEEAVKLAKELALVKNEKQEMEGALRQAREHLEKQHDALLRWKEFERSHVKKETRLEEEAEELRDRVKFMEDLLRETEEKRRVQQNKMGRLVTELEYERTKRIDAERIVNDWMKAGPNKVVALDTAGMPTMEMSPEKVSQEGRDEETSAVEDKETKVLHIKGQLEEDQTHTYDLQATAMGKGAEPKPTLFDIAAMTM